jgi:hypothetical protein
MAGLGLAIYALDCCQKKGVDARDKRRLGVERLATDVIDCPNVFIGSRS